MQIFSLIVAVVSLPVLENPTGIQSPSKDATIHKIMVNEPEPMMLNQVVSSGPVILNQPKQPFREMEQTVSIQSTASPQNSKKPLSSDDETINWNEINWEDNKWGVIGERITPQSSPSIPTQQNPPPINLDDPTMDIPREIHTSLPVPAPAPAANEFDFEKMEFFADRRIPSASVASAPVATASVASAPVVNPQVKPSSDAPSKSDRSIDMHSSTHTAMSEDFEGFDFASDAMFEDNSTIVSNEQDFIADTFWE